MSSPFPHLLQPIRIGAKESRNRVMRLATTTNTGKNGMATDRTIAIYRRLAKSGIGVVVTESMRVHPSNTGRNDNAMLLYRKDLIPSLGEIAQAVQSEGALLVVQLNHGGRQHHGSNTPTLWAPSAIACPHSGAIPHAMSKSEVAEVVAGFALAASHAQQAGCDGVEIHGAQGHLIQQFASAFSNRRDDEYGGSVVNRLRFASEIIAAVRDKVGADFIIGYRMGYEEFTPGGIDLEESKEMTQRLVKLGVLDYLSLTQGNFNTIETHCPDSHYGELPYIDLQAQIKAVAGGVPVVGSTRIHTPEQGEAIIAQGKADMIGMCRALIADPEWTAKALAGRSSDIRRCISTSKCWGAGATARLHCCINPTTGNELDLLPLTKAPKPKRIVIIGGGPAGLEAARVAADRGHTVVLFEKKRELGGKLVGAERFKGYFEAAHAVEFLARQAVQSGATLRPGVKADVQSVLAERPDSIIAATGATVIAPPLAGDGSVPVYAYEGEIPADFPAGDVVVMDEDGYYWAAALTEALARQGRKVTYVTRFLEPLRELPQVARISTLRAFDEREVACYDNMYVDRADKGTIVVRHYFNHKRELRLANISAVVWLGVQRVNDELVSALRGAGATDVRVVGDAYAPRRLSNAIGEGHRAAYSI